MDMTIIYGFEYLGQKYGWYKKKLYRLPIAKNGRSYFIKEIKPHKVCNTIVYNCSRKKLTINRLKELTTEINVEIKIIINSNCPF